MGSADTDTDSYTNTNTDTHYTDTHTIPNANTTSSCALPFELALAPDDVLGGLRLRSPLLAWRSSTMNRAM
jgi:hypothetical protein